MIGAKRHELPINGSFGGPGTSEYGFIVSDGVAEALLVNGKREKQMKIN